MVVVATLVALALAGCVDEEPQNVATEPEPTLVTAPGDFSQSDGSGWHVHDYWGGEDELPLIEGMSRSCEGCSAYYSSEHGAVLARFLPEPEKLVPQGTQFIHVKATWSIESGDHSGVSLWAKGANESSSVFIGELEQGREVTFNSTNDNNDPPHQTLSLWQFELRAMPTPGNDGTNIANYASTIDVRVEKGLPIPEWPPHPDHWNGATELLLNEGENTVQSDTQTGLYHVCNGCVGGPWLEDNVVVPFDTNDVVIEVTTEAGNLPPTFALRAHGANSRTYTDIPVSVDEVNRRVWTIDTEQLHADSPYAKQTLWAFSLQKDQVSADGLDFGHWQGTYRVTVTAYKDS